MEEKPNYSHDLASIRQLMERSVKFISLSGLSGVMAGLYALIAAYVAFGTIYEGDFSHPKAHFDPATITKLFVIGAVTLILSMLTGWLLSYRKAKKLGLKMWTTTSQRLMVNMGVPLMAGGIFVLALMYHGWIGHAAPASLIFYGLALISASQNLFNEIRYLGYCQLLLGLLAAFVIGYGLVFWALGFGVLHIVYGVWMYRKYDA